MKTFIIENGVLKKYRGRKRDVVIPDGVEVIARNAFQNHHSITSIHIPEGVTKIEEWAFSDCHSLQKVSLPDSVVFCGNCSFSPFAKGNQYKGCAYLGNDKNPYHVLWKGYDDAENAPEIHSNTKLILNDMWNLKNIPEGAFTKYDNAFYIGS